MSALVDVYMELDIAFAARGFLSCATVHSTIIGEIAFGLKRSYRVSHCLSDVVAISHVYVISQI